MPSTDPEEDNRRPSADLDDSRSALAQSALKKDVEVKAMRGRLNSLLTEREEWRKTREALVSENRLLNEDIVALMESLKRVRTSSPLHTTGSTVLRR